MKSMHLLFLIPFLIGALYVSDPPSALEELNVDYKLRGYFYAGSGIIDTNAAGGFGRSDNMPIPLEKPGAAIPNALYFTTDTTSFVPFAEAFKGYRIRLVNGTLNTIGLEAQDSRLNITGEAFHNGAWNEIEYLPSSWCGNSYHEVFIKSNHYWDFAIPVYHGTEKCNIRYKLVTDMKTIYSGTLSGSVNEGQLKDKQGYTPAGIMDPYLD